jgi:hypothetical protein
MTSSLNSGLATSLAASSLLSEPDSQRYLSQARAQRKPFVTFLIENDILDSKPRRFLRAGVWGTSAGSGRLRLGRDPAEIPQSKAD